MAKLETNSLENVQLMLQFLCHLRFVMAVNTGALKAYKSKISAIAH